MFPEMIAHLHNCKDTLPAYVAIKNSIDHNHMVYVRIPTS